MRGRMFPYTVQAHCRVKMNFMAGLAKFWELQVSATGSLPLAACARNVLYFPKYKSHSIISPFPDPTSLFLFLFYIFYIF